MKPSTRNGLLLALIILSGCNNQPLQPPSRDSGISGTGAMLSVSELTTKADQGDRNAQFELGALYHDGEQGFTKDPEQARMLFEKAAEQGETRAQFNLGVMHYTGEDIPQDLETAQKWFTKAAGQGNPRAEFNLGVMYYRAEGVKQNYKKAFDLFERSALQGFSEAQFNLGVMYATGEGMKPDAYKAYAWFSVAEKSGNPRAGEALRQLKTGLTSEQLAAAQEAAASLGSRLTGL